jgi:hypothetical protein
MKFRQTILARTVRQVVAIGTGSPRIDAVQKIKDKYKFLTAPERYQDIFPQNPAQPITFQGGQITIDKRDVGILQIQFLQNMIVVDTQTSTDDSDWIVEDYINSANKEHPESITPTGVPYYVSQIEFNLEKPPEVPPQFQDAAKIIDRFLADYGETVPKFQPWGMSLNIDGHELGVLPPAFFALERRVGFPFNAKVFFSQAPLRTKDHLVVLEKLDSIIH